MAIKKVTIENFKRINFVEVSLNNGVLELHGPNAAGKTSVIEAIEGTLLGARKIPSNPIQQGKERSRTVVETDDYKAERRFWRDKNNVMQTELIVTDKQDHLIKKPQEFLNKIHSDIFFRPTDFISMQAKERLGVLKRALNLDFTQLDSERLRLFNERREVGREVLMTEGHLRDYKDLPEIKELRDSKEVINDISEIKKMFDREVQHEASYKRDMIALEVEQRKQVAINKDISLAMAKIGDLESQIKELQEMIVKYRQKYVEATAEIEAKSKSIKSGYKVPQELRNKFNDLHKELKEINLQGEAQQRLIMKKKLEGQHVALSDKRKGLSLAIDKIDNDKKEILKNTQFPISNMSFGEDDILFNGVPFANASTAEQIKMAVAIYAKLQPELRLIMIPEGSALDNNSIMEMESFAEANGFQIILETVQKGKAANRLLITEGQIGGGKWEN